MTDESTQADAPQDAPAPQAPSEPAAPTAAIARISPGWRIRLGVMAVGLLAFGAWSIYDGVVSFPEHNRQVELYEPEIRKMREEHGDAWQDKWAEYALTQGIKGWKEYVKLKDDGTMEPQLKSQFTIMSQYVMAVICVPLGLWIGFGFMTSSKRWIAMDERGLTSSAGDDAPFDKITKLNKERWWKKGIAVVHYDTGGGEKKLTLDDFKFEREPTEKMLEAVEARLTPDQIVGQREPLAKLVDPDKVGETGQPTDS